MGRSLQGRRFAPGRWAMLGAIAFGTNVSTPAAGETLEGPPPLASTASPGASMRVAQFAAGAPGERGAVLDLSAAHALVREFGMLSAFAIGDAALARVLADDAVAEVDALADEAALEGLLAGYAGELEDVVVLRARADRLPKAQVRARDGVAIVRPGHGAIDLPADTQLVVLDLRELPASDALEEMLARAVGPALSSDVPQPARLVRTHDGPADEVENEFSTYSTGLSYEIEPAIAATGTRDLPLVLLLGETVSPQVARFAVALRAARRAWIAGAGLALEIAESTWQGVGELGLMVRTSELATLAPRERSSWGGALGQGETHAEDLEVTADTIWRISLEGAEGDELDLYLVRDPNGDGALDDAELVLSSTHAGAEERLEVIGWTLPPARYQVLVFAAQVAEQTAPFTLQGESATVARLPDLIAADLPERIGDFRGAASLRQRLAATPPALTGPAERPRPVAVNPFGFLHHVAHGRGELRADLLIAHGVLRLFFPYADELSRELDERLLDTLAAADEYSGSDRFAAGQIVRRFGAVLNDGHQFSNAPVLDGTLPVFLEYRGARPLVRRSLVTDIQPGDAIVALDGRPIEQVYAEELARTSAATDAHRRALAERYVYTMSGPRTLTLEDTFGVQRDVVVEPQPFALQTAVAAPGESERPSGTLADVGAPELYYFNMDAASTPSLDVALLALEEASAVAPRGMVLDMRGYPGVDHQEVAARLIEVPFTSPRFGRRVYVGPGEPTRPVDRYLIQPLAAPAYHGPIVLLTGPHAASAAENFMQMLIGAGRVIAVVGRQSAGTNGNITGLSLPGRFLMTYTGLEVKNPDGSRFFGIGIVPDRRVPVRAEDLRDGIDRPLLEAIEILRDGASPTP